MAIWDDVSNFLSGGGRDDINSGYSNANAMMQPYLQQGQIGNQQLQNLMNRTQGQQTQLDQYGNPADWSYRQINQSPTQFYNNIMSSYTQSPDAQYAQQQAMRAANAGAAASGMLGSGAYFKGLQNNANDIAQRDRQQFFNNAVTSNAMQQGYLGNYQNQQNLLSNRMQQMAQYLSSLGYGAAGAMAGNDINQGRADASMDQSAFNDLMGLAGAGAQGGYNSYMGSQTASIPPYFIKAALAG